MKFEEFKVGQIWKVKASATITPNAERARVLPVGEILKVSVIEKAFSKYLLLIDRNTKSYIVYYITYTTNFTPDWAEEPTPKELEEYMSVSLNHAKIHLSREVSFSSGMRLGADPEIFVMKGTKVIPSWKFLGSKPSRVVLADYIPVVYWDGFQAEFAIKDQSCIAYLVDRIREGLVKVSGLAKKFEPSAKLTYISGLEVDQEELDIAKLEHIEFGCLPSLNIYNESPVANCNPRVQTFRAAGGHMHFQLSEWEKPKAPSIVKMLDRILGPLLTLSLQGLEDPRRRMFYGRAGEFRLPSHGVEYRVPSSTMYLHPVICHMAFNMGRIATRIALQGLENIWETSDSETREVINNLDTDLAKKILERNKGIIEQMFRGQYGGLGVLEKVVFGGAKEVMELDIEKNWHLDSNDWIAHSEATGTQCKTWKVKDI